MSDPLYDKGLALVRQALADPAAEFRPGQWEAVHAVVVPRTPVTADQLIRHCRAAIAGYKVPKDIELRGEPLPKSGAGKLLKREMREPYWAGFSARVAGA